MLTTHLQTEAEKWFAANAPLILGQGEKLAVSVDIVEEKKKGKEKALYPRPTPLRVTLSHAPFKLLYSAVVSQQRLDSLKRILPEDAYQFLETLLLKFGNQPTRIRELAAATFGEKKDDADYPARFRFPEDATSYFRQLFGQLGITDLRVQIAHYVVQLWMIEPQEDTTRRPA